MRTNSFYNLLSGVNNHIQMENKLSLLCSLQTSIIRTKQVSTAEPTVWVLTKKTQLTSATWRHTVGCLFTRCILFCFFSMCWLKDRAFPKRAVTGISSSEEMLCRWKRIPPRFPHFGAAEWPARGSSISLWLFGKIIKEWFLCRDLRETR